MDWFFIIPDFVLILGTSLYRLLFSLSFNSCFCSIQTSDKLRNFPSAFSQIWILSNFEISVPVHVCASYSLSALPEHDVCINSFMITMSMRMGRLIVPSFSQVCLYSYDARMARGCRSRVLAFTWFPANTDIWSSQGPLFHRSVLNAMQCNAVGKCHHFTLLRWPGGTKLSGSFFKDPQYGVNIVWLFTSKLI